MRGNYRNPPSSSKSMRANSVTVIVIVVAITINYFIKLLECTKWKEFGVELRYIILHMQLAMDTSFMKVVQIYMCVYEEFSFVCSVEYKCIFV